MTVYEAKVINYLDGEFQDIDYQEVQNVVKKKQPDKSSSPRTYSSSLGKVLAYPSKLSYKLITYLFKALNVK